VWWDSQLIKELQRLTGLFPRTIISAGSSIKADTNRDEERRKRLESIVSSSKKFRKPFTIPGLPTANILTA
jgi:hypothetical protein